MQILSPPAQLQTTRLCFLHSCKTRPTMWATHRHTFNKYIVHSVTKSSALYGLRVNEPHPTRTLPCSNVSLTTHLRENAIGKFFFNSRITYDWNMPPLVGLFTHNQNSLDIELDMRSSWFEFLMVCISCTCLPTPKIHVF